MMALLPLQAIDMSLANRAWVRCNSGTMCGVFGHDSLAWCQAIVPRTSNKGVIVSSDNNTALVVPTNESALSLVNESSMGDIIPREFKNTTQYTLKVLIFNDWACDTYEYSRGDKEALKALRKKDGINAEYRKYKAGVTHQIAALASKAKRGTEVSKVVVKIDNKTQEVVNFQEHHGEVKVPKPPKAKAKDLEAKLAAALEQIAELTAAASPEAPAIEV